MVIDPFINQILDAIKDLALAGALNYLVQNDIDNFLKSGYEKIAQVIRDKQSEKKYAFVPNRDEAIKLKILGENPSYKTIYLLVPNYKYIDLIRTGLLILEYSKIPTLDNRERIAWIKKEILRRPGGKRLLKIVNLPSTEFFSLILKYLHELKINSYPETHIESEFEELVEDWRESSLFVENRDDLDKIIIFCHNQAQGQNDRFFILATQETAVNLVEKALADLNAENFFSKNYYKCSVIKDPEILKIEIIATRKDLL